MTTPRARADVWSFLGALGLPCATSVRPLQERMLTETRSNQDGSLYGFPPTTPLSSSYGNGAAYGSGAARGGSPYPPAPDGTAGWAYPQPGGGAPTAGWEVVQDAGWVDGPAPWDNTGGWVQAPGMPGQPPAAYGGGQQYGPPDAPPYGVPQYQPGPGPGYEPPPPAYQRPPAAYQPPPYQPPPAAYQPPPAAYQPPPAPAYQRPPPYQPPPAAYQPPARPAQPVTPPPFTPAAGGPAGAEQEASLFRLLREYDEREPLRERSERKPRDRSDDDDDEDTSPSPTAQAAAEEDEQLLKDLGKILRLLRIDSVFPRLVYILLGYCAIGPLALAYVEAVPLPFTAAFVLAPAATIMILLGRKYPKWGKRAFIGWVSGIVATIIYDVVRLSLVPTGIWDDPIPAIGDLLLVQDNVPWYVGYAWRFFGNGGGMAIAFTMLPWRGVKAGLIYGTLINTGLFIVLGVFPVAQEHFFPFTPFTIVGGYVGHWTYGSVLGYLTQRFLPPVKVKLLDEPEQRPADPSRGANRRGSPTR